MNYSFIAKAYLRKIITLNCTLSFYDVKTATRLSIAVPFFLFEAQIKAKERFN